MVELLQAKQSISIYQNVTNGTIVDESGVEATSTNDVPRVTLLSHVLTVLSEKTTLYFFKLLPIRSSVSSTDPSVRIDPKEPKHYLIAQLIEFQKDSQAAASLARGSSMARRTRNLGSRREGAARPCSD